MNATALAYQNPPDPMLARLHEVTERIRRRAAAARAKAEARAKRPLEAARPGEAQLTLRFPTARSIRPSRPGVPPARQR